MTLPVKIGRKTVEVPWGPLDRFVAWVSPSAGMDRLRSRLLMSTATGGYTGGKRDRRATRNWRPLQRSRPGTSESDA